MRVLELYSGIGGMHYALKGSTTPRRLTVYHICHS